MSSTPPYTIAEILKLRSEGWTYSEIGRHFNRSDSRMEQVIKRDKKRKLIAAQPKAVCIEIEAVPIDIQAIKDLDMKLSIEDLLRVLNLSSLSTSSHLPVLSTNILRRYFGQRGMAKVSLRDMMEFLIPAIEYPADHHIVHKLMPIYSVRGMGLLVYAHLIRAMSAIDCPMLQVEWAARKNRLRDYLLARKGLYPYILHGRDPALGESE